MEDKSGSRAQSALEYLMTYGWALIVIAVVVGVLVYIMSGNTELVFFSTDSDILLKDSSVSSAGGGGQY